MKNNTIRHRISEKILVTRAFKKLKDYPSVRVCCEVPILGRSVDLAYVRDGLLFTVEFKLHDWRKAVTQARDHLLGADHSYICMPQRVVSEEMRLELDRVGLGLVFYKEEAKWPFVEVIKAPPSSETWEIAKSWVLEYIEGNEGTT